VQMQTSDLKCQDIYIVNECLRVDGVPMPFNGSICPMNAKIDVSASAKERLNKKTPRPFSYSIQKVGSVS
jgi:hypothetical protein